MQWLALGLLNAGRTDPLGQPSLGFTLSNGAYAIQTPTQHKWAKGTRSLRTGPGK